MFATPCKFDTPEISREEKFTKFYLKFKEMPKIVFRFLKVLKSLEETFQLFEKF